MSNHQTPKPKTKKKRSSTSSSSNKRRGGRSIGGDDGLEREMAALIKKKDDLDRQEVAVLEQTASKIGATKQEGNHSRSTGSSFDSASEADWLKMDEQQQQDQVQPQAESSASLHFEASPRRKSKSTSDKQSKRRVPSSEDHEKKKDLSLESTVFLPVHAEDVKEEGHLSQSKIIPKKKTERRKSAPSKTSRRSKADNDSSTTIDGGSFHSCSSSPMGGSHYTATTAASTKGTQNTEKSSPQRKKKDKAKTQSDQGRDADVASHELAHSTKVIRKMKNKFVAEVPETNAQAKQKNDETDKDTVNDAAGHELAHSTKALRNTKKRLVNAEDVDAATSGLELTDSTKKKSMNVNRDGIKQIIEGKENPCPKRTDKHHKNSDNLSQKHQTIRRAPAPPGDYDGDDDVMVPSRRGSHKDPRRLLGDQNMDASTDGRKEPHKKSFTKAVVAAAVCDATVNGRPFSSRNVRDKQAMSALSSDPVCYQHFQAVGQSFKATPSSPQRKDVLHRRGSKKDPMTDISNSRRVPPDSPAAVPGQQVSSSSRTKSTSHKESRRGSRRISKDSVGSVSAMSSGSHSTASEAAKEVLDQRESGKHELTYKIELLESLFEEIDEAGNVTMSPASSSLPTTNSPAFADRGDAKVPNHRRKAPPSRDIEQDPCLIKAKAEDIDLERCVVRNSDEKVLNRRESLAKRLSHIEESVGRPRFISMVFVTIFLVLGVSAALVGTLWKSANEADASIIIDYATMAPTSFQIEVLPLYTQQAFDDPLSPQARAYYWLEREDHRSALSLTAALQQFVLATLFYATKGGNWQTSGAWMSYTESECMWYTHEFHSVCDSAGQFHTLSLPDNNLQGTLPRELELLSSLSIVQLQNNGLQGTIPSGIWSSWNHLVFLNLFKNSLTGTIPPDIGKMRSAKHLNTLSLRSNKLSGSLPPELGLLHLEFLSLSGNRFTGTLPSELGLLSNARDLYLYDNQFFGSIPSTLGLLTKLTRLELHNNNIIGKVPPEVCDLLSNGNLVTLTVDCEQVHCTCGCDCTATIDHLKGDSVFDKTNGDE